MERELIVTLLKKNIDDLILLTEGFEEMTSYPRALIQLAQLKTTDIKQYLYELGEWKPVDVRTPESIVVPVEDKRFDISGTPDEMTTNEAVKEEVAGSDGMEEEVVMNEEEEEEEENEEEVVAIAAEEEEEEEVEVEVEDTEPAVEEENSTDAEAHAESETEVKEAVFNGVAVESEAEKAVIEAKIVIAQQDTDDQVPENNEEEKKQLTLGEKLVSGITRNELHTTGEANRISSPLGNTKINDIRQAISIGDRFRFQRELFRNNGEEMNKMLNYINLLASFQEIETFLQKKYAWTEDNQAAKDLYAIVRRKFL